MKKIKKMDVSKMKKVTGVTYYGNGLSCDKSKCWVDWSKTVGILANNSVANLTTGGGAGWNK